jgi:predicted RNA-binding Zn-ribbon protein involved in translation (DUF1610 family)
MRSPKTPTKAPKRRPFVIIRCPNCGSFVAAGRDSKLLELAQRYHACPESLAFALHNQQLTKKLSR